MFHVEHELQVHRWLDGSRQPSENRAPPRTPRRTRRHQSGAFAGRPIARGHRSSGSSSAVMMATAVRSSRANRAGDRPSSPSRPAGQRPSPPSPGGSLTARRPPQRRKPTAHSAVTAGGPNARAATRSKWPRHPGCLARSSARPHTDRSRSSAPRTRSARVVNTHRRRCASNKTPVHSGQQTASTRPGTPAPLPRSRKAPAGAPTRCANTSPCAT